MLPLRHTSPTFRRHETYEQWHDRMLVETAQFIEWGLAHPEQVRRIPTYQVGKPGFSESVKKLFWSLVIRDPHLP